MLTMFCLMPQKCVALFQVADRSRMSELVGFSVKGITMPTTQGETEVQPGELAMLISPVVPLMYTL